MANLKISQLTATTTNDIGSWVVINNSGETTSNKSQLEYVLGLTKGSGNSSIKSNDFLTDLPSEASSDYSIALGNGTSASTAPSIVAIGNGAYSVSENCVVIGKNAHDQGTGRDDGIAIGTDAEIYQPRAISIGKNAAGVTDAITIGTDGRAIASESIAIGASTVVAGNRGTGIGYDIFQDRDNATVVGALSYVSGRDSTVVGADNGLGQNGGDSEYSVIVGASNQIYGPYERAISIGYNNQLESNGIIVISSAGIGNGGALQNSNEAILIGGSGLTFGLTSKLGNGNIKIGGIDDTFDFTPGSFNTWIGGKDNTWNPGGGFGQNNVFLGISGRSITAPTSNTTYVENLQVYRQIRQNFTTYTGTSINIDVAEVGYANIEALSSGGTYTISVDPAPNNIGTTLTLFIEYQDGATIVFNAAGSVQWKWDKSIYGGAAPSFSATTGNVSRSIIVLNTWDGNDMWEVSRSMNME